MLFNSIEFIFVFLPTVAVSAFVAARTSSARFVQWILLAASLIFYAWLDASRLPLLLGTIFINYALAGIIRARPSVSTACLAAGVIFNLGLLAYFKYRGFILGDLLGMTYFLKAGGVESLPLGISFFTFQQLAWLFDSADQDSERPPLSIYALFVTFFPQLIAGPIVHHKELVPQLTTTRLGCVAPATFAAGVSLFAIGLFKKVVVADSFAYTSDAAFGALSHTALLDCGQAWTGLGAYACQIYFDFSGYSDMAIGLGLMFGIVLPANFFSPYKAQDMADFWRRWHITLSRFLREFVYIPLGGSRVGRLRQSINLVATMVLGGIWHGAGYTFLLWGLIHGILLAGVHLHRDMVRRGIRWWPRLGPAAPLLTLPVIMLTWVPFRADSLSATKAMYASLSFPCDQLIQLLHFNSSDVVAERTIRLPTIGDTAALAVMIGLVACLTLPASVEMFRAHLGETELSRPASEWAVKTLSWKPNTLWATLTGLILFFAIMDLLSASPSAFLYFQF